MKKRETDREFVVGARVVVNEKAPGGYLARQGTILENVLGSRYGVKLDNQEVTVYLESESLDAVPQISSSRSGRRVDKGRMSGR